MCLCAYLCLSVRPCWCLLSGLRLRVRVGQPGQGAHFTPGTCTPVKNYTRWYVQEYGYVKGGRDTDKVGNRLSKADKMKAEIIARSAALPRIAASCYASTD